MRRLVIKTAFEDIKNFFNMLSYREQKILEASKNPLPNSFKTNELAEGLHPQKQIAFIKSFEMLDSNTKILTLSYQKRSFARFRAGQGINIKHENLTCFYPILSSPDENEYKIVIFKGTGVVSDYLFNLEQGEKVELSGPFGLFYYSSIRDGDSIALICDLQGMAPVLSICKNLSNKSNRISIKLFVLDNSKLFDLDALLSDFSENIHINKSNDFYSMSNSIKNEIKKETAFFVSGTKNFCENFQRTFSDFKNLKGKCRYWISDPINHSDEKGELYTCTVIYRNQQIRFECSSKETLLNSFQKNNVPIQSNCKIGECGYCRSKLINGQVKTSNCVGIDSLRSADKKYHFIHPCLSFPTSDLTILI